MTHLKRNQNGKAVFLLCRFSFAFVHSYIRRSICNMGRIDAFASKNEPFHPRPNSFGRCRYPNPHRNRKTRNRHSWKPVFGFVPLQSTSFSHILP
jgi:hypothetical protein